MISPAFATIVTDLNEASAYAAFGLLLLIAIVLAFRAVHHSGFELGHLAGSNEERSRQNARVIKAKMDALHQGIHFAFENHDALKSRKGGNVAMAAALNFPNHGNGMPPNKGESRCQAVGCKAEGEVPTIAPADHAKYLGSNRAPEVSAIHRTDSEPL